MRVGRGGCRLGIKYCEVNRAKYGGDKDYVDKHLDKVRGLLIDGNNSFQCNGCGDHSSYYRQFGEGEKGWDNFVDTLCLRSYLEGDEPIKLNELEPREFCVKTTGLIKARAEDIARNRKEALIVLFNQYGFNEFLKEAPLTF
jgi:hypothetical protein